MVSKCKVLGGFGAILAALLAVVARFALHTYSLMQLNKELDPSTYMDNTKCTLMRGVDKELEGAEDLALGKHGKVFIGSGDLYDTFHHGAASAVPGGVYVFDVASLPATEPARLELKGLPKEERTHFQVHGIFVSNATDRLYTVTHRGAFSSVEIFAIAYDTSSLGVSLQFVRSVRSDLFPNQGINDVVEGQTKGELYVSRWQYYPMPATGQHNPQTIMERVQALLSLPLTVSGLKLTQVYHCAFSDDAQSDASCAPATAQIFLGANGMTTNADRSTVYVSDPLARKIHAFHPIVSKRSPTGKALMNFFTIDLPHAADNIEYDVTTGEIIMGTMPLLSKLLDHQKNSSALVDGGMVVARPPQVVTGHSDPWTFTEVNHDGAMLSQVSAALRYGSRVMLGSPHSKGVLVCDL